MAVWCFERPLVLSLGWCFQGSRGSCVSTSGANRRVCPDVLQARWASLHSAQERQGTVPVDENRRGVIRTLREAEHG